MASRELRLPHASQKTQLRQLAKVIEILPLSKPSWNSKTKSTETAERENLLGFSQNLYAHCLTLQGVIRARGKMTHDDLRAACALQAAQQFEIFRSRSKRFAGRNVHRLGKNTVGAY